MRTHFVFVMCLFALVFLGGCISSYEVEIIKAHEMLQDMEAIELDQPDLASDLPETGIHVNNKTERTILVKMRRKKEQVMSIPPGASSSMALSPGKYHYMICEDETADEPRSKAIYIHLQGTKRIVEKCVFMYDVFTKKEVVDEKRLEELRSR